ncbi:MAG: class I SAM-dependent methyltransferase [Actinomycetes bacterium]
MSDCCDPSRYDGTFGDGFARRLARRYRRKGLDRAARRIVDVLEREGGVAGATVLEIGGGIGDIQLELLKRGATRATNLELSHAYEAEAAHLAVEAGLAHRITRRHIDLAATPELVEPADVVVLHRVVCCYPDYRRLLAAVAGHTRQRVVFTHPPRTLVSRLAAAIENVGFRLRGSDFRVFTHSPTAMRAVLAEHGLQPRPAGGGPVWKVTTATR